MGYARKAQQIATRALCVLHDCGRIKKQKIGGLATFCRDECSCRYKNPQLRVRAVPCGNSILQHTFPSSEWPHPPSGPSPLFLRLSSLTALHTSIAVPCPFRCALTTTLCAFHCGVSCELFTGTATPRPAGAAEDHGLAGRPVAVPPTAPHRTVS